MLKLVITEDGSHTIFVPGMEEHYHSIHGAITESKHVFIRNGLDCLLHRPSVTILETGFGTGLNALLTLISAGAHGIEIYYHALEKFALDKEVTGLLNYPSILEKENKHAAHYFESLHGAPWDEMTKITPLFNLRKIRADIPSYNPDFNYDLVYFDAFGPEKQPEMWAHDVLTRIVNRMTPGGVFATYCVKGTVRRTLKEAGLTVSKHPGPPGKHEILRGVK